MLGRKSYPASYVATCRAHVADRVESWDRFAKETEAADQLEAAYFTDLVLVLEQMFVHRLRGVEGKDGNPMNEVRVLAASLLDNGGRLAQDGQIRLDPARSVLGLAVGDPVVVDRDGFTGLAEAYFAALEERFAE